MKSQQKGIGLVEVMVALLLLVVAVLGFSALQMQAVQSTDESLLRSQATNTIMGLTEAMRENIDYLPQMKKILNGENFGENCLNLNKVCNKEEMAKYAAKSLRKQAIDDGYDIKMITCPGTTGATPINCIILAWKDTKATQGDGGSHCIRDNGIYNKGATCLLMEAY